MVHRCTGAIEGNTFPVTLECEAPERGVSGRGWRTKSEGTAITAYELIGGANVGA